MDCCLLKRRGYTKRANFRHMKFSPTPDLAKILLKTPSCGVRNRCWRKFQWAKIFFEPHFFGLAKIFTGENKLFFTRAMTAIAASVTLFSRISRNTIL
jgi:hypothetical protein